MELNVVIIHNCAHVTSITDYFKAAEFDCVPIFKPYATSVHFGIRLHAKFILGYLYSLLSQDEIKDVLELLPSDMSTLLQAFELRTTSNSHVVSCQDCTFSMVEVLTSLNNLVLNPKNCESIVRKNIIPSLAAFLACGSVLEQKSGCQLLWSILNSPGVGLRFKEQIQSSEIPLIDCLRLLTDSDDESLSFLAQCILTTVDPSEEEGKSIRSFEVRPSCRKCSGEQSHMSMGLGLGGSGGMLPQEILFF